jgi:5-(carboxyamino)imidazole ribonucleotide synthase
MTSTVKRILPGSTIGIIGGGQLGKMLAQSALRMGFKVAVLDPSHDAPASATCHHFIQADFSDEASLRKLAEQSDVLTYEFENIDAHILKSLVKDYYIPQGAETVLTLQNRQTEKDIVKSSGANVVPFEHITTKEDVANFARHYGYPVIIKTSTGGYDGKGQYFIDSSETLGDTVIPFEETEFIVEKYLDLEREVSLTVACSPKGQMITFPLQENLHRNQVLYRTIAPSRLDYTGTAVAEVTKIMETLHFVGVFTVEFFIDQAGSLYVNELAPRPHNSAHHTIESCNISQFDAHILAITNQPMPDIYQLQDAVMMNLLGEDLDRIGDTLLNYPEWHVHLYGKTERKPARKMGHITLLTNDIEETLKTIRIDFEKES